MNLYNLSLNAADEMAPQSSTPVARWRRGHNTTLRRYAFTLPQTGIQEDCEIRGDGIFLTLLSSPSRTISGTE